VSVTWTAFVAGVVLSLSTIAALGPQNVHILRMGLMRQHVVLTVLVCLVGDALLIGLSVAGLSQLLAGQVRLQGALVGAGAVFLLAYGWQAAQRARPSAARDWRALAPQAKVWTRRQAVAAALGFSLLNPHAWLDTAVIIGTASLAWGQHDAPWFGAGALTGSALWFVLFAALAVALGRRLQGQGLWRALDALVAAMMWGMALWLLSSLW
jgi:L-lysine exporter family protein LysE/ArgO